MKKKGKELIFISRINNDGTSLVDMAQKEYPELEYVQFKLIPLSITLKTYIAYGFHSYVVKIKEST